jgi:uncharacterized protein YkwD
MNKVVNFVHHFFIPRESNNYKAKALHLDFLTTYLILALVCTVAVKQFSQFKPGAVLGYATDISADKLLQLTNEKRAENNLPPLNYNEKLAAAAYNKAQNMLSVGYWAHFAPDGTTPWSFILGSGYQYSVAGENLAKGFYFSDAVVNAWMNSPSHKENLLRNSYKDVGFAIVNGTLSGEETTLVVQMFGAPVAVAAENTQPAPSQAVQASPAVKAVEAPAAKQPAQTTYFKPSNAVLAKTSQPAPAINLYPILFNTNILFLVILILVLISDFYFTKKFKIVRIGGKNIAHVMFIVFIFLGVYIITNGGIIK